MEIEKIYQKLEKIENNLNMRKEIFNLDELCEFTNLSKSTIYKKTHKLGIPHYKQAGHLYFNRAEIVTWLQENKLN